MAEVLEERRLLATFVVTSNLDAAVPGTLREAILLANATPGPDTITFNITVGTPTIKPLTPLPYVTDATTIDATTQPGYSGKPIVLIDGSTTVPDPTLGDDGLRFTAGSSTVQGLAISGFAAPNAAGLRLTGSSAVNVINDYVGLSPTSTTPPRPSTGNYVGVAAESSGNSLTSNLISGNVHQGVIVTGNGTTIQSNKIGTDSTGNALFPNGDSAVVIKGASNTLVGGSSAGQRNIISGNNGEGVNVQGAGTGNVVAGNYIGIGANGSTVLSNSGNGVSATAPAPTTTDLLIGGTSIAARNLISGNGGNGVSIDNVSGVRILNNYIGVDATGSGALATGNFADGVTLLDSTGATALGAAGAGNVISNNGGEGVSIYATATGNVVQANYIGTNAAGNAALANGGNGVSVFGDGALIGGGAAADGNVISANTINGINLAAGTSNSSVQFNLIGLAADGTSALGNGADGVFIDGHDNQIGSPTTGNSIAYNGHNGITVGITAADTAAIQNAIRGNNIYLDGALGIDLGNDGVTMNDPGDADTGPNMLQNFPVLTSVTLSGSTATISGTLNSTPNSTFALDFFASQIWDTTHYGEGQKYLGSISVTTDASGNASFTATMPGVPSGFNYFAATATDANGNTSEFCYDPEAAPTPPQPPAVGPAATTTKDRAERGLFKLLERRHEHR